MKELGNDFYEFDEATNKLKFYSDEFELLMEKCNIKLNDIELDVNNCSINCYIDDIQYENLNYNRFEELLKKNIPYIQDILLEPGCFILTFRNVDIIDLF